jgi:hypothetical protein
LASVVRKASSSCSPSNGALLGPRAPRNIHRPAKANSGRSASRANHFGVLRSLVSAYSQKRGCRDNATARRAEPSSPVRAIDVANVRDRSASVLRGPGIPHRDMISSRSPSGPRRREQRQIRKSTVENIARRVRLRLVSGARREPGRGLRGRAIAARSLHSSTTSTWRPAWRPILPKRVMGSILISSFREPSA